VRDEFGLCRYLAVGLAVLQAVETGAAAMRADLSLLADELDAEALRNSAGREIFTNPAKSLAERMTGRGVVLTGDNTATLALARHLSTVLLRVAHQAVAAAGLADAVVALRDGMGAESPGDGSDFDSLFHDEELDGPLPQRPRVLALTLATERPVVSARVAGVSDVDLVGTEDVPDEGPGAEGPGRDRWVTAAVVPADAGRPEQQLAVLAVRVEMAAVYMRLVHG
jgi:hypothetical protein